MHRRSTTQRSYIGFFFQTNHARLFPGLGAIGADRVSYGGFQLPGFVGWSAKESARESERRESAKESEKESEKEVRKCVPSEVREEVRSEKMCSRVY